MGESSRLLLNKFQLYESKTKFYVVGSNTADPRRRILKIDKNHSPEVERNTAPPPVLPNRPPTEYQVLPLGSTINATSFPLPPSKAPNIQPHEDKTDTHSISSEKGQDDNEEEFPISITEDAAIYSEKEFEELLFTLRMGNGGVVPLVENNFHGIVGFVKFTSNWYLILIKAKVAVALIGGRHVYHCEATELRPLNKDTIVKSAEEARRMKEFLSVDMGKNFYFSYSYDITNTLQRNLTDSPPPPINDKWVWNAHLLRPAFGDISQHLKFKKSDWCLPMIHGFVDQAKISVYGYNVYMTLIARRSRHFAGARFHKRGVNSEGYVANDVETEQIVSEATTLFFDAPADLDVQQTATCPKRFPEKRKLLGKYTSFIQIRGSIPLFWSQEGNLAVPKPPIEMTFTDPFYTAAAKHFNDLFRRYGAPVHVINLIKQYESSPRESKLGPEFKQCIDYLNQFLPDEKKITYTAWDMSRATKKSTFKQSGSIGIPGPTRDLMGVLDDIAEESMELTGFFHSGPAAETNIPCEVPLRTTPMLQRGVARTNCIDCLDRTNAAQFVLGKVAFGHQLQALGIISDPRLAFDSKAVNLITEVYHDHGDTLALQYGGSHLVNTMNTYRDLKQWRSHSRDMIENIKRYYSNSFVDADKQVAIDSFLGITSESLSSDHPSPSSDYLLPPTFHEWYTPSYINPGPAPWETDPEWNVRESEVDWFNNYYKPKRYVDIQKLLARRMNGTRKAEDEEETYDEQIMSPFIAIEASQPILNLRNWSSASTPRKTDKNGLRQRLKSLRIDEVPPTRSSIQSTKLPDTSDGLATHYLNPHTSIEEEKEYEIYIDQFSHISPESLMALPSDENLYREVIEKASNPELESMSEVDESLYQKYTNWMQVGMGKEGLGF